jgi:hypothetical protein
VLFIALSFSGCEQFSMKPEHITVNIMVSVYVKLVDVNNNILQTSPDGISMMIEMTRNRKDRLVFDRIVQNGLCQATGDFELSEGQFIECTATAKSGYQNYYQVGPATSMLTWETVNASTNYGGVYNWYTEITIHMKNNSTI